MEKLVFPVMNENPIQINYMETLERFSQNQKGMFFYNFKCNNFNLFLTKNYSTGKSYSRTVFTTL